VWRGGRPVPAAPVPACRPAHKDQTLRGLLTVGPVYYFYYVSHYVFYYVSTTFLLWFYYVFSTRRTGSQVMPDWAPLGSALFRTGF